MQFSWGTAFSVAGGVIIATVVVGLFMRLV